LHEPIVPEKTFAKAKQILKERSVKGDTRHEYLFHGIAFCGYCGRHTVAETVKHQIYYRCRGTGHKAASNEKVLKEFLQTQLEEYGGDPSWVTKVQKAASEIYNLKPKTQVLSAQRLIINVSRQHKLDRLT